MKPYRPTSTLVFGAAVAALGLGSSAAAGIITNDPSLPSFGGYYQGGGAIYDGGSDPFVRVSFSLSMMTAVSLIGRTPSGANELEDFNVSGVGYVIDSSLFADVDQKGVIFDPLPPVTFPGVVSILTLGKTGHVTGTFPAEVLLMNLGVGPFIRESPTLESLGRTTITDLGGGDYRIESYFDIFTELSRDGGATWIPSSSGPLHVELVPEPGSALLAAVGIGGWLVRRRRAK